MSETSKSKEFRLRAPIFLQSTCNPTLPSRIYLVPCKPPPRESHSISFLSMSKFLTSIADSFKKWCKLLWRIRQGRKPEIIILFFLIVLIFIIGLIMVHDSALKLAGELLGLKEKNAILEFLIKIAGGFVAIWSLIIFNKRASAQADGAKAQADSAKAQAEGNELVEQGHRQERFRDAIQYLSDGSDTIQLGAIYAFYHLAREDKDRRKSILDILCADTRNTTRTEDYEEC